MYVSQRTTGFGAHINCLEFVGDGTKWEEWGLWLEAWQRHPYDACIKSNEWTAQVGAEVGSLQGCVALVGSSLIALLSEHRWAARLTEACGVNVMKTNQMHVGEGCLPERVWHRSCWSLFLFRKRLPRFSNLADVINFDFCQLAMLPDHAWKPKYVPVYVRYLRSPYEGGHQCQPNASLVSFLYVGRTRFCRWYLCKRVWTDTSEDW